jgi:acyl dehydratase
MLIPSRKKGANVESNDTTSLPPVTRTTTFKVAENTGRRYAAGSGDYNPWHLWPQTAKIFGFRKAIAQGFWSVNKTLAEVGKDLPAYPLKMEVEWKK